MQSEVAEGLGNDRLLSAGVAIEGSPTQDLMVEELHQSVIAHSSQPLL